MHLFYLGQGDLHYPGRKPQSWIHPEYVLEVEKDKEKMSELSFFLYFAGLVYELDSRKTIGLSQLCCDPVSFLVL